MLKTLCFVAVVAFVAEARLTPVVCKEPFVEMKSCMHTALAAGNVNIDANALKACFADCGVTSKLEKLTEFHDCMFEGVGDAINECVEESVDEELEDIEEPAHKTILRYRLAAHHQKHKHAKGQEHRHRYRRSHHEHAAGGHHDHGHHDQAGHHLPFVLRKAEECSPAAKACVEAAFGEWASEAKQTELHAIVKEAKNNCILAPPAECRDAVHALARAQGECMKENVQEYKAARSECMSDDIKELFADLSEDGHPRGMSLGFDPEY
jgi:hypothetical protein